MASVFFSYAHADEVLRDQLEKQLSLLKRQAVVQSGMIAASARGRNSPRRLTGISKQTISSYYS